MSRQELYLEVQVKSPQPWLRELEVEIEPGRLKSKVGALLAEYKDRAEVPGFRPGRVPIPVLEKRLGTALESTAVEELVRETLAGLLDEKQIRPATEGRLTNLEVTPEKLIRYQYSVEVIPDFELKPYTGLKLKREEPTGFDAEFDRRLRALQEKCATYKPVPRPARGHDFVVVDYTVLDGGSELSKRQNVMLMLGSDDNLKEINEALEAAAPGQERTALVRYPDDYPEKNMAGRTITYRFAVHAVKERILPEVNEELATDLGFDNLDALRQAINDEILADRARLQENGLKNQIFEYLIREHEFEPPPSWVAASTERLLRQYELPDDATAREKLSPIARKWAKFDCLVTLIAGREQLSVTDEEIAAHVEKLAAGLKKTPEEVAPLLDNPSYRNQALRDKVMAFLLDKAQVN